MRICYKILKYQLFWKVLTNSVCQPISGIIEADFDRCAWVKIITVSSTGQSCWVERHNGRVQNWNWSNGNNGSGSKYHRMRWQQRSNRRIFEIQESESTHASKLCFKKWHDTLSIIACNRFKFTKKMILSYKSKQKTAILYQYKYLNLHQWYFCSARTQSRADHYLYQQQVFAGNTSSPSEGLRH